MPLVVQNVATSPEKMGFEAIDFPNKTFQKYFCSENQWFQNIFFQKNNVVRKINGFKTLFSKSQRQSAQPGR